MSDLKVVTFSPHIRSKDATKNIMRDVIIALVPTTLVGFYVFGINAIFNVVFTISFAVLFELLFQKIAKQKVTIKDLSAVVTGLLLALNLPPGENLFMALYVNIVGAFVAIVIVKQLFGGLGQNFMNPALGARALLLVSFAEYMTSWHIDGVTTATPLALVKEGKMVDASLLDTFIGSVGGSIGEVSAVALLLGGIYLVIRKVISPRIPLIFITTVAIMVVLFGGHGFDMQFLSFHIFSGGLMIGAIFMATDYSSSPMTAFGQVIFAAGCGLITGVIRLFGGYPEGVSFAIIIMNLFVPLIDRCTIPRAFGEEK